MSNIPMPLKFIGPAVGRYFTTGALAPYIASALCGIAAAGATGGAGVEIRQLRASQASRRSTIDPGVRCPVHGNNGNTVISPDRGFDKDQTDRSPKF
jgi:hypothetical protein